MGYAKRNNRKGFTIMKTVEQKLLEFDANKENIPRQITSIVSLRETWGITQRKTISTQVKNKEVIPYSKIESKFDREGIMGTIERQEDALKVAAIIAGYKYTIKNHYLSDIGAGLYTMVTQNQGLYDVQEIGTQDRQGNFEATGVRIICSIQTLYKAAFGSLVNHKGNAINGAGDIIDKAKEHIIPIVNGEVPMPRAYASVYKNEKQEDGSFKEIKAVIEGEPMRIYRKVSGAKDALVIDLDYFFFPCRFLNDIFSVKKGEMFIHRVAGQTVFLQLGSRLVNKGKERSPIDIDTAVKILTAAQAGFEMGYFAPGIVKETSGGRVNISLRRAAVQNLYPSAVDSTTGRIRFKDFSEAVSLTGQYFNRAMEFTGIKEELLKIKDKNGTPLILIPAEDKGAEFPEELPGTVYIKADRLK